MSLDTIRNEARFIGDGTERECFVLPDMPRRCIKISKPGHGRKQHEHDLKLYKKVGKRPELWKHIARFHGIMDTPAGEGLVFETVRDFDDEISKSLLHFLYHDHKSIDERMFQALLDLEAFILRYNIILKDPSPSNLLYRRLDPERGHFILIDGIEIIDSVFPPLQIWARRKVKRQWKKVIDRMLKETKNSPDLQKQIQKFLIRKEEIQRS